MSNQRKGEFYDMALEAIKDNAYFKANPEKLDVSIKEWLIAYTDHLNAPEKWSFLATKIQGIMNQSFFIFQDGEMLISADYINLKNNIIKTGLVDPVFRTAADHLPGWKNLLRSAVEKNIMKLVDDIIENPEQMESLLNEMCVSSEFLYGDWSAINISVINAYNRIESSLGRDKAIEFFNNLLGDDGPVLSDKIKDDILGVNNPFYGMEVDPLGLVPENVMELDFVDNVWAE